MSTDSDSIDLSNTKLQCCPPPSGSAEQAAQEAAKEAREEATPEQAATKVAEAAREGTAPEQANVVPKQPKQPAPALGTPILTRALVRTLSLPHLYTRSPSPCGVAWLTFNLTLTVALNLI